MNDLWILTETLNYTALILAASVGYKEIVELLMRQNDIDINIKPILNLKHSLYSNLTFDGIEKLNDLWNTEIKYS